MENSAWAGEIAQRASGRINFGMLIWVFRWAKYGVGESIGLEFCARWKIKFHGHLIFLALFLAFSVESFTVHWKLFPFGHDGFYGKLTSLCKTSCCKWREVCIQTASANSKHNVLQIGTRSPKRVENHWERKPEQVLRDLFQPTTGDDRSLGALSTREFGGWLWWSCMFELYFSLKFSN